MSWSRRLQESRQDQSHDSRNKSSASPQVGPFTAFILTQQIESIELSWRILWSVLKSQIDLVDSMPNLRLVQLKVICWHKYRLCITELSVQSGQWLLSTVVRLVLTWVANRCRVSFFLSAAFRLLCLSCFNVCLNWPHIQIVGTVPKSHHCNLAHSCWRLQQIPAMSHKRQPHPVARTSESHRVLFLECKSWLVIVQNYWCQSWSYSPPWDVDYCLDHAVMTLLN